MAYKVSASRKLFLTFNVILCVLIMVAVLFPLWMAFATSVAPDSQVIQGDFVIIPKSIGFSCYTAIFQGGYFGAFLNSIFVAVVGTILSIVMTLFTGYALAQKDLIGRRFFMGFIFITLVFNAGIIPFYFVVRSLKMIDTYWALFIPVLIQTYYLILMKNFMISIPESLIESARLDGCSELGILFKIVAPVSIPIIAAITLFYVVFYWNQYINVVMFINSNDKNTIQVLLRQLVFENSSATTGANHVYNNFKMGVMFVAMLPVLVLYPFIQRYFISGIMMGSIKE
ncbi:MAG TPA: carbohydrate ABC transporter permease [Bacillota bacterium]|nr:carbohydrate ABC transporter permease [Bacillota bacterium]